MQIVKRMVPNILDDVLDANVNNIVDYVDIFKKDILRELVLLNSIVTVNYEDLFCLSSLNLLKKFYYVSLEQDDYAKLLKIKNNKSYIEAKIPTKMITKKDNLTNKYNELYQVIYCGFVSKECHFNHDKNYSKEELAKMIIDNDIVITENELKPIDNYNFAREDYCVGFDNINESVFSFAHKNPSVFIEYIKKYVPRNSHYEILRQYLDELRCIIQDFFLTYQKNVKLSPREIIEAQIIDLCQKWFINNNISCELDNIENILKEKAHHKVLKK